MSLLDALNLRSDVSFCKLFGMLLNTFAPWKEKVKYDLFHLLYFTFIHYKKYQNKINMFQHQPARLNPLQYVFLSMLRSAFD